MDKIKEKVTEIIGKISDKAKELVQEITDRGSDNPLMGSVFREMSLFKRESILSLVTNYNGTVKSTRFRLFLPTVLDVDGDGKKDVRVWVFRRPGVDFSPPAVCLKTTLVVRRLNDDIKSGPFEIYLEYKPKIISKIVGGALDRIRIGYQTPMGAEIPDFLKLTHTYVPRLIYPRLKPMHKLMMDPGSAAGKTDLNLLFSVADMNGDNVSSQQMFNINYNPVVKTQVSFGRLKKHLGFDLEISSSNESKTTIFYTKEETGNNMDIGLVIDKLSSFNFLLDLIKSSKGNSTIEYERLSSNKVNVTLFKKNSDNFYFYIKPLPKQIVATFLPESVGWMNIDTFGEYVNEIGFCNDLVDPSWRLYFSDLPSVAKLNWTLSKKKSLEAGSLKMYGDTNCSVHLNASLNDILSTNSNADVKIDVFAQNNIDMSFSWDFEKQYLQLDQSKTDLNLSLSIHDDKGNTFDGSCTIKNLSSGPFTVFYDELSDEKVNLSFSGKSFDVYNLHAETNLEKFGNFTVITGHILKNKNGNLNISMYATKNGSYIDCNCTFIVTGGIEIYDLLLGYNGVWHNRSYIIVDDNDILYFQFGGTFDVVFNIADDLSWGYIALRGSVYIDVDFKFISNKTSGIIKGKIHFNSNGGLFNISWVTVSGERQFTFDGSAIVSLSNFIFKLGDIINISIPVLSGKLKLENVSKVNGAFKLEFQGKGSLYLITSFKSSNNSNQSDVQLNVSIDAYIKTGETPGVIAVSWDNYNVTSFETDLRNSGVLTINDLDIKKTVDGNKTVKIENLSAKLSGYLHIDITHTNTARNTFVAVSEDADIDIHIGCFNTSYLLNNSIQWLDLGSINISINSTGRTVFSLLNFTNESFIEPIYAQELNWYNLTMSINANNSIFILRDFYIEHFANYSTIILRNFSVADGYSKIKFSAALNLSFMVARFANLFFNNSQNINILLDNFSLNVVLADFPPVPTTIYSGKLTGGILDIRSRFFGIAAVEITNGSAIDHLGIDIIPFQGTPSFHFNTYICAPVDYLFFEVNDMEIEKEYILIDTHNTSTKMNLTFLVPTQQTLPGSKIFNTAGFRIDNVTIQADKFIVNTPNLFSYPENASIYDFSVSGYIHLEGGGNIWFLVNGVWHPLYQYNGSLTVTPGHLKLEIDGDMSVDRIIPLSDNSILTVKGNFTADNCIFEIWWERTIDNSIPDMIKIEFNGDINIKGFLFKVEYNDKNGLDKIAVSWQELDVLGPAYFNISSKNEPSFNINCSAKSFDLTNFEFTNINKTMQLGSTSFSGEFSISTLPEHTNSFYYIGFCVEKINGVFEIENITMPSYSLDKIDRFYFDGYGDISFENWVDLNDYDTHVVVEIQNSLNINCFEVDFDNGASFKIEHLSSGAGYITSGYIHAAWNIYLDADGMVFLDSGPENNPISFHNLRFSYNRPRQLGWGIRLRFPNHYFDADLWCIQWDPLWYNPNTGVFIIRPLSIHIDGVIQIGRVDLEIYDGNYWYYLGRWPILP
ncbi:MAG: hypothetical protein QHH19_00285 [Candidatus Thermoplasmatota archaeon]|nr:hypothetical protein [Candidatus Thermoplasmatota archaeon]